MLIFELCSGLRSILASITAGFPGNPSNGFRKRLLENLEAKGNAIKYIGSLSDGDFGNTLHEGHGGKKIKEISSLADKTLGERPNVVLLHAGTNDLGDGGDLVAAAHDIDDLIGKIATKCPDAAVMVARILHTRGDHPALEVSTLSFNNLLYGIVQKGAREGQHIYLVDQYTAIPQSDLADNFHPIPEGYTKMGDVWNLALQQVNSMGLIKDPVPVASATRKRQVCNKAPSWNHFGPLLNGGGLGKDFYDGRTCVDT